ncbi:DUF4439 domain-containing protein [Arthrobacter cavernae]|nr:DUF4439 domain-containing protein [Arthrobacter cavernae]
MPGWARTALVFLLAAIVLATGMVLIPRDPGPPPAAPFSESARVSAFADTLSLLDAATGLRTAAALPSGSGLPDTALADTVTLLTTQSRALLAPAQATPASSAVSPAPDSPEGPRTPQALVAALSASGAQRLADAAEADGGIARLLAAVGTAHVLQSAQLAAAAGLPAPATPVRITPTAVPTATESCPAPAAPSGTATAATLAGALAAAVRSEQEAVYVHQVALTRLDPAASGTAQSALTAHQTALRQAEALGRAHCLEVPPREAGYRLPEQLSTKPLAALGALEAGTLQGFGDLIALGTGDTRQWALDGLLGAARRSTAWGTPLDALPGLVVDAGALPPLPAPSAATTAP